MKTRVLFILAMLQVGLSCLADLSKDPYGYYAIGSSKDLVEFTLLVRGGNQSINGRLMADIDMQGVNDFIPIGLHSDEGNHVDQPYHGIFDGNGHVIKNLEVTMDDSYEVGFISRGSGCTVKNLGIVNAKMTSNAGIRAGVIGGELHNCVVENCYVVGNIEINTTHEQTGAIAGEAAGSTTFKNCFTSYELLTASIGGGMENCFAADDLAYMKDGELCFMLNGDQSRILFYQNLGTDAYPCMDDTHKRVYAIGELFCDGTPLSEVIYSNDGSAYSQPAHQFDADGYCTECGTEEGIIWPGKDDWYEITTGANLRYFSRMVNRGNNGANARLMNDISLDEILMSPIGIYNDNGSKLGYHGTFDGQNHIISNLTISVDDGQEAGLFGRVNGGGSVRNLGIVNASITNDAAIRAGVIAGEIHACTITNCFTAGYIEIVTDHEQKGGISGEAAASSLINCYTTYDVLANSAGAISNCIWGEEAQNGAENGELCFKMNGQSILNPTWYQTLEQDLFPVLDSTHGLIYKTGEETYKSAKTQEEYAQLVPNFTAYEIAVYSEKIADKSLINEYVGEMETLSKLGFDDFIKEYAELEEMRSKISQSENAYTTYQNKIDEIKEYLENNPKMVGPERTVLETYLDETSAPDETYPQGSYPYIIAQLSLDNDAIAAETAFAQGLLDNTIANCYQPGSEITKLMVNADFSDQVNGWELTEGTLRAVGQAEGCKNIVVFENCELDMNQTLTGLTPGLYEFHISGYSELKGVAETAMYNFGPMIYANDNQDYIHTHYTSPLNDEEAELHPTAFGELYNTDGEPIGWGPSGFAGVCYAYEMGHFENRILVNITDSTLTVGVKTPGAYDSFLGNARLYYLGSIDDAGDKLDEQLIQMVNWSNLILDNYYYVTSNYIEAPNFSEGLKSQLKTLVTKAASVTDNMEKYQLIQQFGELFESINDCKHAYVQMMEINEDVYDAVYTTGTPEEALAYESEFFAPIVDAYIEGSYSYEDALAMIEKLLANKSYMNTYGIEPEAEEGVYMCATPYNLIWVARQVNQNINRSLKFALANDIDMSEIYNFTPIGLHNDNGAQVDFNGTFDGRGHVIKNLKIECSDGSEAGFFSRATGCDIRNVGIVNATVRNLADIRAGVLGGELLNSRITNCFTAGELVVETTNVQSCGLAGESHGSTVTNCYTTHPQLTNDGRMINCYSSTDEYDIASGELCFKLNDGQPECIYYQTLGEDAFPVLDNTHKMVYAAGSFSCDGTPMGEITYNNTSSEGYRQPHEYDEDGYCINCGTDRGYTIADINGIYHLETNYSLRWFATHVNDGNTSAHAVLENDIDMTGIKMIPIGRYSDDHEFDGTNRAFYGTFDGQGHEISNLNIVIEERYEGGLFGRAAGSSQIHDFGLVNVSIVNTHERGSRLGAICGEANGTTISNVYIVGDINLSTSNTQLASFAGEASGGNIVNCYTTSDLPFSYLGDKTNCYNGEQVLSTMESGELCYLLNEGETENPSWRQNIGTDPYPILRSDHLIVFEKDGTYFNQDPDAISTPQVSTKVDNKNVYSLTGMKVGTSLQGLPKGIYIVGGRKVLVK